MAQFLFKRSGTANKRPDPAQMVIGELDLNYDAVSGGIFYKDSGGGVVKVGPAQVGTDAPNSTPAGSAGNSPGEFWYNTGDGFLYIWDGASWASTAPGVGVASPTVPGVVYGLTGDTDLNVALGKGSGSNITTGTCNVAIGPNVAVASATGNCQLAIGYSATANWLTGDSTKAIQPGAGILDCASSTGSAGQLLSSTGSNALEWITPDYISSTALNASSVGALIVNGCDLGGGTCYTAILPGPAEPGQILTNAYNPSDPGYLVGQGYLNWCTPNYISQSSFSPGALVVGCNPSSTGGICTVGTITNANNPGVAVGYYQGVTVTSALTGTGALANVNVINVGYFPSVDSIEITQPGTGYALSETVRFTICGNQITTCALVASLNQSTICKAGYLSVGTNGQVLTVDSSCALGVKWAATSGGSGIPCACITGQGALITGTAANTPTALAVGTAGQVLTVDLTCSEGLKWATPSTASSATPLVAGIVFGCTLATGTGSTALGSGALKLPPVGVCNVGVGLNAGCGVNNGACNTIVGALAGDALTDGCNNTVLGFSALSGAATTCDATAVGSNALCAATGAANTAVGSGAMKSLTTGACNTAVGVSALCSSTAASNNTAVGYQSQFLNNGGTQNTSLGVVALYSNVTGIQNTAIGNNALTNATSSNNTAVGTCASASNVAGANNTSVGNSSLKCNTSGSNNASVGINSLFNVIGSSNVAVGSNAGCTSTAGDCNVVIGAGVQLPSITGSCQLAVGFGATCWLTGCSTGAIRPGAGIMDCTGSTGTAGQALLSNGANAICWGSITVSAATPTVSGTLLGCSTASRTAVGCNALLNNTAVDITAVGICALCANTTGDGNTAVGAYSMQANTNGTYNTAVGISALRDTNGGLRNAAVGENALRANTSGCFNVAVGSNALRCNLTTTDNTAVGFCSLFANVGTLNTAVGSLSLNSNTSGGSNTAVGVNALRGNVSSSGSTAVGLNALCANTAAGNSALGCGALKANTTGTENVAIGCGALLVNVTGSRNTAVGTNALPNSTGCDNIAIGTGAILNNLGGSGSVAIGSGALGTTNGSCNIAIGLAAGCNLTNGTNNVAIGTNVDLSDNGGSCQLAIGWAAGSCWLTGCSTGAIRPSAGLMDCTGGTGGAGQVLMSTGANALVWGDMTGISATLLCCQNAASCGANGGNLIVGSYGDGSIVPAALNPGTAGQILTISPTCNVNPVRWCTANYLCGACFSKGAIAVGCNQVGGGVGTLTCVAPNNPGVSPGYYADIPITGGSGTGLTANINIINAGYFPIVDSVEVSNPGTGYLGSNSGMTATINGTTLSTTFSVASLNSNTLFNYSYLAVGTNGQVLTADSACTNGVKWASAPGGIPCATITGKGALVTGTAASTPTALSVGTDGQILIACNACTTGLTWGPNVSGTVAAATPTAQGIVYGKFDCGTTYPDTAWDYVAYGFNAGNILNQFNAALNVTAIGNYSMQCNSSCNTTAIGHCSAYNATAENSSVFLGYQAGFISCGQTANGQPIGSNVYVGAQSGCDSCGSGNTFVGAGSGAFTIGTGNTFIGASSGTYFGAICANALLCCNIAIGGGAGSAMGCVSAATPECNIYIGSAAASSSTNGSQNIALGSSAQVGSTASCNITIGLFAGGTGTGGNNVALGTGAGSAVTTAANTIIIGCCAGTTTGGVSGALTTQSNRIVMGNSAHTCAQIQIAWSTTSDVRDKALDPAGVPYGLLFVEQLEPIAYRFCNRETNEVTDEKLRYGFSAQNIRSLEGDESVIVSDENPDKLALTDQHLLPVLVNAIKELSEKNKLLEERIAILEDKA